MNRTAIKDEMEASAFVVPRQALFTLFRDRLSKASSTPALPECTARDLGLASSCKATRPAPGHQRRVAIIRDVSDRADLRAPTHRCEIASISVLGRPYFAIVEYFEDFVVIGEDGEPEVRAAEPHRRPRQSVQSVNNSKETRMSA